MEIAVDPDVPTYSGGLGILAGDTIRSVADLHVPMVAVMPLARRGYYFQRLDSDGRQSEKPVHWAIGERNSQVHGANSDSLYEKLEQSIVPMFYGRREQFIDVMRHAIALNGSYFNTQRMVHEYLIRSYMIGNPVNASAQQREDFATTSL